MNFLVKIINKTCFHLKRTTRKIVLETLRIINSFNYFTLRREKGIHFRVLTFDDTYSVEYNDYPKILLFVKNRHLTYVSFKN